MRNFSFKIWVITFFLFFSSSLIPLAYSATGRSSQETTASDTAEKPTTGILPEAEEIEISEKGIYIRTREGEKIILSGRRSREKIVVNQDRIRIGDMEIDLKELKGLKGGLEILDSLEALNLRNLEDISSIEIPKMKIQKRRRIIGEDIVKFGKGVEVEVDEEIDGDVVAIGGDIKVRGVVTGDVVAIGGDVTVFSTGEVEGDAVSIGGDVTKRGEGIIRGEKVSVRLFQGPLFKFPFTTTRFPFMVAPFQLPAWAFFARVFKIMFFIFLGIVVISVVPKHVGKVKEKVKRDFLKSILVGAAAEVLALPIFILLIITIIGIPVALLVEPLLILMAIILGYTGTCLFVGEKLREHTSLKPDTQIMTLVMGILAVEVIPLTAQVIKVFGTLFSPLTWVIAFIGWMIGYVVITVGLGASILTRLGTRPRERSRKRLPQMYPPMVNPPVKGEG